MGSAFRKKSYKGVKLDFRSENVFEGHLNSDHKFQVRIANQETTRQLLEHARSADPSKLPAKADYARDVPDKTRIHRINITQGDRKHLPISLDAVERQGNKVLYRFSAAGPGVKWPHPSEYPSHFVVDPKTESISYYSGFLKDSEMRKLFNETKGDPHDRYWGMVDEAEEKQGLFIPAKSAEFEPERGRTVHIRSRVLRNAMSPEGRRELYSVDFESALPEFSKLEDYSLPSIVHRPGVRNRVGEFNPKYKDID